MAHEIATVWVGPARLDDRLDTRPYKPWVLAAIDKCRNFSGGTVRLGSKDVCSFLARGVGGGAPTAAAVAVFKAKEVTGYGFARPELFLDAAKESKLLRHRDVALTSSGIGTIGRADIFYVATHGALPGSATVDNHVTIIRLKARGLRPGYLAAFLNSTHGKAWSEWGTTGSTRLLELAPTRVRRFEIPNADANVQDYIGAKVELAYRYRHRANSLLRAATARFNDILHIADFHPSPAQTNQIGADMLVDRLTSIFYLKRYYDLESHLQSLGTPLKPIERLLRDRVIRSSTPERTGDGAVPCILTSDIDPHEIRWREPSLRVTPSVHNSHVGRLDALDVVYTSVGPPVGEAAVVLRQFLPMAVGGDVSILRHGDDLHPGYLSLFLNSVFGQMQNDRYSRGIRQRRVYPEDIGAFLIPVPDRDDQTLIGDQVVQYQVLSERAFDLVNEAKADVEALIEGTLNTKAIVSGKRKPPTEQEVLGA